MTTVLCKEHFLSFFKSFFTFASIFSLLRVVRPWFFYWQIALIWDPNFSPFCNEIPLLNGTDLTQILWDPSWKKKEDLTSISEKVNICYTFDEKKVNNNFFLIHAGRSNSILGNGVRDREWCMQMLWSIWSPKTSDSKECNSTGL